MNMLSGQTVMTKRKRTIATAVMTANTGKTESKQAAADRN